MQYYEIFGGCLQSEIVFPELRSAKPGRADWTLRIAPTPSQLLGPVLVGEELLVGDLTARLVRDAGCFRLSFDDTGIFDVSLDGREIRWSPAAGASPETARSDVLGRVLSLAVHAGGGMCLHASAVALPDGAVAFLGPKGHGKTTLALALVSRGARLLADDTVCVSDGAPPTVAPGVLSMRIRADVARQLGRHGTVGQEDGDDKLVVRDLAPHEVTTGRVALGAVYVLAPVRASGRAGAVHRRALTAVESTLALVHHAKISALLARGEAGALLATAGVVARAVPVYVLEVARDLERLEEGAAQLSRWHGVAVRPDELASAG
jgi:hypothetical protein